MVHDLKFLTFNNIKGFIDISVLVITFFSHLSVFATILIENIIGTEK